MKNGIPTFGGEFRNFLWRVSNSPPLGDPNNQCFLLTHYSSNFTFTPPKARNSIYNPYLLLPPFPSMASWIWYVTVFQPESGQTLGFSKLRSRLPLWTERSCGVRKKRGLRTWSLSGFSHRFSLPIILFCLPSSKTNDNNNKKKKIYMWNYISTEWVFFFSRECTKKNCLNRLIYDKMKPYWPTCRGWPSRLKTGNPYNGYINPETNVAHEDPSFPGKYHQNGGFSMAMLVYRSVYQPLL